MRHGARLGPETERRTHQADRALLLHNFAPMDEDGVLPPERGVPLWVPRAHIADADHVLAVPLVTVEAPGARAHAKPEVPEQRLVHRPPPKGPCLDPGRGLRRRLDLRGLWESSGAANARVEEGLGASSLSTAGPPQKCTNWPSACRAPFLFRGGGRRSPCRSPRSPAQTPPGRRCSPTHRAPSCPAGRCPPGTCTWGERSWQGYGSQHGTERWEEPCCGGQIDPGKGLGEEALPAR